MSIAAKHLLQDMHYNITAQNRGGGRGWLKGLCGCGGGAGSRDGIVGPVEVAEDGDLRPAPAAIHLQLELPAG